jgi:hypothetical protein
VAGRETGQQPKEQVGQQQGLTQPLAPPTDKGAVADAGNAAVQRVIAFEQENASTAGVDAQVDQNLTMHSDKHKHIAVEARKGTTLSLNVDPGGISFGADPPLRVRVPGPDLLLDTVRYDFGTAQFQAGARAAHFDPLHVYGAIAESVINHELDKMLKPLLPDVMKRPYDPKSDPEFGKTIKALEASFGKVKANFGDKKDGAGALAGHLGNASVHQSFKITKELTHPIGVDGLELHIDPDTSFSVEVSTNGDLAHPKVVHMSLSCGDMGDLRGIALRKGKDKAFQEIFIHQVDIARGQDPKFKYDLMPEHFGTLAGFFTAMFGTGGHVGLAAAALPHTPPEHWKGDRAEVDKMLKEHVPALLHDLLAEHDQAIPGFSLLDIFG